MAAPLGIQLRVETPRMVLRSPEVTDAKAYAALMSNPLNIEHDPASDGPEEATEEEYRKFLTVWAVGNRKGEKALFAIALRNADGSEGPVIGMGGFPWLPHNAEGKPGNTGALIDSAYSRKGYATEALMYTLDYGFDTLGFEVIEQTTHEANDAYRALMRHMGFEKFGQRRGPTKSGLYEMNYPVNRKQWQELKAALEAKQQTKST